MQLGSFEQPAKQPKQEPSLETAGSALMRDYLLAADIGANDTNEALERVCAYAWKELAAKHDMQQAMSPARLADLMRPHMKALIGSGNADDAMSIYARLQEKLDSIA